MDKPAVHWSHWASQPYVMIACSEACDTPKFGPRSVHLQDSVYELSNGGLYAFDETKVTCMRCLTLIEASLKGGTSAVKYQLACRNCGAVVGFEATEKDAKKSAKEQGCGHCDGHLMYEAISPGREKRS